MLDSIICIEYDGDVFCKFCYGKFFGFKGYGFVGGFFGLFMDIGNFY